MNTIFKILTLTLVLSLPYFSFGRIKIIVKFKESNNSVERVFDTDSYLKNLQLVNLDYLNEIIGRNYRKILAKNLSEANNIISILKNDPNVISAYVEPKLKIDFIPNDSLFKEQWALKLINAPQAWNITKGKKEIKIGLIDTGVKLSHEDLIGQLAVNPAEDLNGNGIFDSADIDNKDNDGNGFVDDVIGWNFVNKKWSNLPNDDNGHGTFIAGILVGKQNNKIGISGVAPECKILDLKAFDSNGYGDEEDVASAIFYAVSQGVKVINMSFGDTLYSVLLKDAIKFAYDNNVVLIASSGNTGTNVLHYPSSFSETISVGAVNQYSAVASFSSYGSNLDLVAPGVSILTTSKDGDYKRISGTSASAPFVSATAALILTENSEFSNEEIKQILKSSTKDIAEPGWDEKSGAGLLNTFSALSISIPTIVKFDSPTQDQGFSRDTIPVEATIIDPDFEKYSLFLGMGANPEKWSKLKESTDPVFKGKIFAILMKGKKDSIYTLMLEINKKSGRKIEERVNFFYDVSPPKIIANEPVQALLGEKSTVFAELRTDDKTSAYLHFKTQSEPTFHTISLDGFNQGIKNVRNYHWGIVPTEQILSNTTYDVYLTVKNMSGLNSSFKDSHRPFYVNINEKFAIKNNYNFYASLPDGNIFKDVLIGQNSKKYILFKCNNTGKDFWYKILEYQNGNFIAIDSIKNIIPLYAGKYGADSSLIIVGKYQRTGFVLEQVDASTMKFEVKFADSSGNFFPVLVNDLNNDGTKEIICNQNDEKYLIYTLGNDLIPRFRKELLIYDNKDNYSNKSKVNNNIAVSKIGSKTKLWILSPEGNLICYNVEKNFTFTNKVSYDLKLNVNFSNSLSVNNGADSTSTVVACFLNSKNSAPYHYLSVMNFKNGNVTKIYEDLFLDDNNENGIFKSDNSKITFASALPNQNAKTLFINVGNYFYILDLSSRKYIYFNNFSNNLDFFAGNFTNEDEQLIAFKKDKSTRFFSFEKLSSATAPFPLNAYETSDEKIYLSWEGEGSKYYIYRSIVDSTDLKLIDSTKNKFYYDTLKTFSVTYYYRIKAFGSNHSQFLSAFSPLIKIFAHSLSLYKEVKITPIQEKVLNILFKGKINLNPGNFNYRVVLNGETTKPIVSANSQNSYLLFFNKPFLTGENEIKISNFRDYYGAVIPTGKYKFNFSPNTTSDKQLFIERYKLLTDKELLIKFNLPLEKFSALEKSNYSFNPVNPIEKVEFYRNNFTIKLTAKNPVGGVGINYILQVSGLFFNDSTGNIPLREGAGSYVLIQEKIENLNKVFVFPNPVISSRNSEIHFAKLPENCEIEIFSINGKHIAHLVNNSEAGGVKWNLRNKSGNLISSGVYLYKAIEKDEFGNVKQSVIKKFAVIK